MSTLFEAATLARAWLAVAEGAATKTDTRPILSQTISIEVYPEGARLIATDSYMLVRAWVPCEGETAYGAEPDIGEVPVIAAIAHDPDGRARGLLKYALSQAVADKDTPVAVRLGFGRAPNTGPAPTFDGLETGAVFLDYPDHERVTLLTIDGDFPNWRSLGDAFKAVKTDKIALNPDVVGRVLKCAKYQAGPIQWEFGGHDRVARFSAGGEGEAMIQGLVMPVRVDPSGD